MTQTSTNSNAQLPVREQWFDMKQAAKLIGAGMGRTKLFRYLRAQGFLMENNEPYQAFIDEGVFKMVLKDIRGRKSQLLFRQMVTLVSETGIGLLRKYIIDHPVN